MTDNEHDQGIPEPPPEPVFFDPTEALRNGKGAAFGCIRQDDAIEAERIAGENAEKDGPSEGKDEHDATGR